MKKILCIILFCLSCGLSLYGLEQRACNSMKKSIQIIYINGPSSSGKTTLAQALQQEFDVPFLHIGIDRVIGMMPNKLNNWEGGPAPLGFSWKSSVDETGTPAMKSKQVLLERKWLKH